MSFENFMNSNRIIVNKWCDNATSPHCPIDCSDISEIIRASWYKHQIPTFAAMFILLASFIHLIFYVSPVLLKRIIKSIPDVESDLKTECNSISLSTEILQQNASTPILNNELDQQSVLQQSNVPSKRSDERRRLLSNELENKANKISAAADALFKSTCLTYINSTCVLDSPTKTTNCLESKNFDSLISNYPKVKNVNKSLDMSVLISQAFENMDFNLEKSVKNWHRELKTNGREHMVQELIRIRLSKFSSEFWITADFIDDSIDFGEELHPVEIVARQDERRIYELSDSKAQYFNRIYSLCQQIHETSY